MSSILIVLILTIILEIPVVLWVSEEKFSSYVLGAIILVNVLTNFPFNAIIESELIYYFPIRYETFILVSEVVITFVEAFCYSYMFEISFKKALIISICANAISYFIGSYLTDIYWYLL